MPAYNRKDMLKMYKPSTEEVEKKIKENNLKIMEKLCNIAKTMCDISETNTKITDILVQTNKLALKQDEITFNCIKEIGKIL